MRTTDQLYKALKMQGNNVQDIIEILEDMSLSVLDGENPEEVLYRYGLEPDYVFELVDYAQNQSLNSIFANANY